jgi:hypothetical protein
MDEEVIDVGKRTAKEDEGECMRMRKQIDELTQPAKNRGRRGRGTV